MALLMGIDIADKEIKQMFLKYSPVMQAWMFLFGSDIQTATIIDIGGKRFFENRYEAIIYAKEHGILVNSYGVCSVAE